MCHHCKQNTMREALINSGVCNAVPCCNARPMSAMVLKELLVGGQGGFNKRLPCHVNLVLEKDVVKSCLQVLLVLNVSLVVGSIHLHHHPHQSNIAALVQEMGEGSKYRL